MSCFYDYYKQCAKGEFVLKQIKFWIKIRDSFWFTPSIYSIAAFIVVIITHITDEWLIGDNQKQLPHILIIEEEITRGLYTSLVTAILTMTTISFSVIMVVLTTYSSQFSPRTLQDFMQSKMTHHILGFFSFGFIFALVNLVLMGQHDTIIGPLLMVLIAIICLALFIFFIHHAAKRLQVSSLIQSIHYDCSQVIKNQFSQKEYGEHESWGESEVDKNKNRSIQYLLSSNSGYIQKIDWMSLINWAKRKNCCLSLQQQIGDYITKDLPLLMVYSDKPIDGVDQLEDYIVIGNGRTDLEDLEFNIQKLVEIAIKALSPSVNDPDTAMSCINRIGSVLTELCKTFKRIRYLSDEDNTLRVIKKTKNYEDFLYKGFSQIVYYGKEDISICYSLLEVLYKMALTCNDEKIRGKIWTFHFYIIDAIEWDKLHHMDRQHLNTIYEKMKGIFK
jgi:uncharacterized membrane protein